MPRAAALPGIRMRHALSALLALVLASPASASGPLDAVLAARFGTPFPRGAGCAPYRGTWYFDDDDMDGLGSWAARCTLALGGGTL